MLEPALILAVKLLTLHQFLHTSEAWTLTNALEPLRAPEVKEPLHKTLLALLHDMPITTRTVCGRAPSQGAQVGWAIC